MSGACFYFPALISAPQHSITRPSDGTSFIATPYSASCFVAESPTHLLSPVSPCPLLLPCPTCSSHSPLWPLALASSHLRHHCMAQTHTRLALPVLVLLPHQPMSSRVAYATILWSWLQYTGRDIHTALNAPRTMVTIGPFLPPPFSSSCLLFSPSLPSCFPAQSKLIR